MDKLSEIRKAKDRAGEDAFLWLHDSGDCILWASEAASEGDDGSNAIERWQLSAEEMAEIEESDIGIDGRG